MGDKMTCCWLHKTVVWSWGSVNSNTSFFFPEIFNVPVVRESPPESSCWIKWCCLSFRPQADNLNLEIYTCRHQVTVGVTNWICFYYTQFYGSYGLAGVISQFSSWGWGRTHIKYLWLIHLKCGDVSSTFPIGKFARYSHRITLLLIWTQL